MKQDSTKEYIRVMLLLFCVMFLTLSVYLSYIVSAYGTRWFASPYNTRVQNLKNSVHAGMILDRNGVRLAYTDEDGERQYSSSVAARRAMCHVIGDTYGQTIGAESMFAKYLLGFDQGVSDRLSQLISAKTRTGSTVMLTLDSELTQYAYDLMDDYWGAVVLMNYKTGEVLASVSQPTFDPERMEDYLSGDETLAASAMVNRVTMGRYTPGSTFKIVTMIAALRYIPNIRERTFNCDGALVFDLESGKYLPDVHVDDEEFTSAANSEKKEYDREQEGAQDEGAETPATELFSIVRDYHSEYHGEEDIYEAFEASCNHVFAQLAMEIGASRLARVAEELGIGEEYLFDDMVLYNSSFTKADTDRDLAWSGVGQYKDLVTPMQMCMLSAAIANNGVLMEPRLLSKVADTKNVVTLKAADKEHRAMLTPTEASFMQDAMIKVVESGTGRNAALDDYTVGGKTGTAEVSSNKSVKTHSWFTGFVLDDEHPLAVCVVLEQAGSGSSFATPLAGKLLKRAIRLGY